MSAVCAEEGSEEKINEEGTSTSNSLLCSDCLCLPLNMESHTRSIHTIGMKLVGMKIILFWYELHTVVFAV